MIPPATAAAPAAAVAAARRAAAAAAAAQVPASPAAARFVRGLVFSKFHRWLPQSQPKLWIGHVDNPHGAVRVLPPFRTGAVASPASVPGSVAHFSTSLRVRTASSATQQESEKGSKVVEISTKAATQFKQVKEDAYNPEKNPLLRKPIAETKKFESILPAGSVMTGLNVMKEGSDPIAMENDKYPSWLWTLLEPKQYSTDFDRFSTAYFRKKRKASKRAVVL